jgi:hypothetical protein
VASDHQLCLLRLLFLHYEEGTEAAVVDTASFLLPLFLHFVAEEWVEEASLVYRSLLSLLFCSAVAA